MKASSRSAIAFAVDGIEPFIFSPIIIMPSRLSVGEQ
jgi:hypothetical protein